jgi:hypothetical protein
MDSKKHTLPDLKSKEYGGAWAIEDNNFLQTMDHIITKHGNALCDIRPDQFVHEYKDWFTSTHSISGLSTFNGITCSLGTTETFDKFYLYHRNKRLRIFRGEYFYQQMVARSLFADNWAWMHEDDIRQGDVLVFSLPFADTGSTIDEMDAILDQCDTHGVPVLVDMAYINLARDFTIDLSRDCIKVITTSLSKVFPVQYHRIGLRLTKGIDDDLMIAYQQNQYVNKFGCGLGLEMMKQFDADYTFETYRLKQVDLCNKLEIDPSPCVIFGVDKSDKYPEYNRGGTTNRLCFSNLWNKKNKN